MVVVVVLFRYVCLQCSDTVGWASGRASACKNLVMRCWCGYLSGVRCRLFAYGPANATAIPKAHHLLPPVNPDWFTFLVVAYPGCPEKRPLNGCSVAVVANDTSI